MILSSRWIAFYGSETNGGRSSGFVEDGRLVAEAKGRIFKRTDGKYFLYLPKHLVEDTAFPLYTESSAPVRVVMDLQGKRLLIMPMRQNRESRKTTPIRKGR
jgi:hypothetical protein